MRHTPFIGASPDGLLGKNSVVEIKCPYTARNDFPNEITIQYLYRNTNNELALKEDHDYYFQIQGQMMVTKRSHCCLVIYTFKGLLIINVYRDNKFITEMLKKLQQFYKHYLKPEILNHHYYRNYSTIFMSEIDHEKKIDSNNNKNNNNNNHNNNNNNINLKYNPTTSLELDDQEIVSKQYSGVNKQIYIDLPGIQLKKLQLPTKINKKILTQKVDSTNINLQYSSTLSLEFAAQDIVSKQDSGVDKEMQNDLPYIQQKKLQLPTNVNQKTLTSILKFPMISVSMMEVIKSASSPGSPQEILVEDFGLRISKHDMLTLSGMNWLNDEIINFYMNLLIKRSRLDAYPNIYAINTFFIQKYSLVVMHQLKDGQGVLIYLTKIL